MANTDTVKAITANLAVILVALGLKVEDASTNPDLTAGAVAQILYEDEQFECVSGQRPSYSNVGYVVRVTFSDKAPGTSRTKQSDLIHGLRDSITVNALNVGNLASSKLVSLVNHNGPRVDYAAPVTTLNYRLEVKYREI